MRSSHAGLPSRLGATGGASEHGHPQVARQGRHHVVQFTGTEQKVRRRVELPGESLLLACDREGRGLGMRHRGPGERASARRHAFPPFERRTIGRGPMSMDATI